MASVETVAPPERRSGRAPRRVPVLDADPDLARSLSPDELESARTMATAPLVTLSPRTWRFDALTDDRPEIAGLLVLEGLLTRAVAFGSKRFTELLGTGDVLRPWQREGPFCSIRSEITWKVLEPARLALLDDRFMAVAGRWPQIMSAIVERTIGRSRSLTIQLAICHQKRIETRLLLLMWLLADRFGKVGQEGVVIPIPLVQRLLASCVGARRPSVNKALQALAAQGQVSRRPDGTWLVRGRPPEEFERLYAGVA